MPANWFMRMQAVAGLASVCSGWALVQRQPNDRSIVFSRRASRFSGVEGHLPGAGRKVRMISSGSGGMV